MNQDELPTDDLALLKEAGEGYQQLRDALGQVIVGQEDVIRALLAAIFAQGHVLLIGVPGLAKTLLVKTLAQALGWDFKRIQFTPDLMPADVVGMELLDEDEHGHRHMRFVPGPIFANLLLADEINRTPPKTQSALLEAMQEYQVTSMGHRHMIERPFIVVATQNPIEQEGTYPLPEAQLDRFMFSLWMDYPPADEESTIVAQTTAPRQVDIQPVFDKAKVQAFQQLVRRMPVAGDVIDHAVAIARATRPDGPDATETARQYVEWGAGTRAAQNMILGAKALATLDGLPAVSSEHVRQVALQVLRHRVLPNYQAAGEGLDTRRIVEMMLEDIAPVD